MKRYRARFNPDKKGVYAVSLVDEPAMEGDFIQFKKENEVKFANVDESKRRIMGLILEPEKEVLRFDTTDNSYYSVKFEAQDIEDVAYNFQKQGNQNNSTIQHDGKNIEGVSFVETWIVEDSKIDKSANFGLEYPKGSWLGVMQLDNDDVWNNYVKTGKVKGFSIDAFMQFEEINLNKVNKMSDNKEGGIIAEFKKEFLKFKQDIIGQKKEVEKTPEQIELEKQEAEKLKLAKEDAEKVEFNSEEFIKSMIKDLSEILEPMKVELNDVKESLVSLNKENETLKEQVIELSKAPATKSVKKAPSQLEYSKMSNYEKMLYNQGKL